MEGSPPTYPLGGPLPRGAAELGELRRVAEAQDGVCGRGHSIVDLAWDRHAEIRPHQAVRRHAGCQAHPQLVASGEPAVAAFRQVALESGQGVVQGLDGRSNLGRALREQPVLAEEAEAGSAPGARARTCSAMASIAS